MNRRPETYFKITQAKDEGQKVGVAILEISSGVMLTAETDQGSMGLLQYSRFCIFQNPMINRRHLPGSV